jgi:hypothetical protein
VGKTERQSVGKQYTHTLDELIENIQVEIPQTMREELCQVAGNIFRRCRAGLQRVNILRLYCKIR